MNRETYEEIKKQIQANFHQEMEHLEALAPRFGVFNPKTTLKPVKNGLESPRKPEMKVLKDLSIEAINIVNKATGYVPKLIPCEHKPSCGRKTNPERKCPSCSKNVCTRHLRGKVCKECNQLGEK